jgi:hypothetical protein
MDRSPMENLREAYALVDREAPKLGDNGAFLIARAAIQGLTPAALSRLLSEFTEEAR